MAYEKLYNEIYAIVSLKYLWKEYKAHFIKSESPDWINDNMKLGLEITQALLPDDGKTESFIEKYLGCLKEELPMAALEFYGDRLYFYNDRFWAVLNDERQPQDYIEKVKFRFDKKLEKLNINYHHMENNGIYIYVHPAKDEKVDAKKLYHYFHKEQMNKKVSFKWVFLNCIDSIYILNFEQETIEKIEIPEKATYLFDTETEKLRHSCSWEDGSCLK